MPAMTSLAIGLGAAGALAGAIDGATDDPDKVVNNESTSTATNQTTFGPKSGELRQAQQNSIKNYLEQQALAGKFESSMAGAGGIQDAARQQYLSQLSGNAFQATPQELQNIQMLRDAQVANAQAEVGSMLDERFKGVADSAGMRGVRGQALGELYGQQAKIGADQLGAAIRQANTQAAQMAIDNPMKRAQLQQGLVQQGSSFQDLMNQQAQQNRQALQDPALLKYLQQEYIQGGKQTTTNTSKGKQVTPGQEGSFLGGVTGAIGGASGGLNLMGGAANALGQIRNYDAGTPSAVDIAKKNALNASNDVANAARGVV